MCEQSTGLISIGGLEDVKPIFCKLTKLHRLRFAVSLQLYKLYRPATILILVDIKCT